MTGQSADELPGGRTLPRVAWVDAAKGAGILLVIAGHVWWDGIAHDVIYAFHMPLFFLLSGYMVKPQSWMTLAVRQVRGLLVPYAVFSLILIGADLAIEGARGMRPIFNDFGAGATTILLHTETLRGPFTILWFTPCLVLARLAWNAAALYLPDPRDWRWLPVVAAALAGGQWFAGNSLASPLGAMAVPAAFVLLWAGQLWRARSVSDGVILLVCLPLAMATWLLLPPVNMKLGELGTPVLSLLGAGAISIAMCRFIAGLPGLLLTLLAHLGRASLIIMYAHVAVIHYATPYMGRTLLFALALAVSLLLHAAARSTRIGRTLLLGELNRRETLTP